MRPTSGLADATLAALIDVLNTTEQGVLKICPTDDWRACYYYWRWSRGSLAGHYVCVLASVYDVGLALRTLLAKRDDVVAGRRKPTKDRYS